MTTSYKDCPIAVPTVPTAATVTDFVLVYTLQETLELTNLDTMGPIEELVVQCDRLNKALRDAYDFVGSYLGISTPMGRTAILGNLNRAMLIIARYYLDSTRMRPDVRQNYEDILKWLDNTARLSADNAGGNGTLEPGAGRIRSFANPRIYTQESLRSYRNERLN